MKFIGELFLYVWSNHVYTKMLLHTSHTYLVDVSYAQSGYESANNSSPKMSMSIGHIGTKYFFHDWKQYVLSSYASSKIACHTCHICVFFPLHHEQQSSESSNPIFEGRLFHTNDKNGWVFLKNTHFIINVTFLTISRHNVTMSL